MKILDPQSAVLTNLEVLRFVEANPPRGPDPKIGGYPVTDLSGFWKVQGHLTEYAQTITPYLSAYPKPLTTHIETLLNRLQKFDLTKPEVLMIMNLGVGFPRINQSEPKPETTEAPTLSSPQEGDLLDEAERFMMASVERAASSSGAAATETAGDEAETEKGREDDSDVMLLNVIVEETDSRFTEAEVSEILRICREVVTMPSASGEDVLMLDAVAT